MIYIYIIRSCQEEINENDKKCYFKFTLKEMKENRAVLRSYLVTHNTWLLLRIRYIWDLIV